MIYIFLRNENNIVDEVILLEGLLDLDLEAAPHEPVADEGHGGLVHPRGGVAVGYAHVHDHTLLQHHRVILVTTSILYLPHQTRRRAGSW